MVNNDDLHQLLSRLRREADALCRADPRLAREEAYDRALTRVFMAAAEALDVSPFEARLLDTLSQLSPFENSQPVPTKRICAELGLPYRSAVYHLNKLEARYLIKRPRGPRSGWKAA